MKEDGYFIAFFKLKDHQDLIAMKLDEETYDFIKLFFLENDPFTGDFIEIIPENQSPVLGWVEKSMIVHRSQILQISFGFQGKSKNVF